MAFEVGVAAQGYAAIQKQAESWMGVD